VAFFFAVWIILAAYTGRIGNVVIFPYLLFLLCVKKIKNVAILSKNVTKKGSSFYYVEP